HIMARGDWKSCGVDAPEVRAMFTRESLLSSAWYQTRLKAKQERDVALWTRHIVALQRFRAPTGPSQIDVAGRLAAAQAEFARVSSARYLTELVGTIGADPL